MDLEPCSAYLNHLFPHQNETPMSPLFEPLGTPAEKFMLMLHERVIALEQRNDMCVSVISSLQAQIEDLITEGTKTYDVMADLFSDYSKTDWYIWEPVDTIHVYTPMLRPIRQMHLRAMLKFPSLKETDTHRDLFMPVRNFGRGVPIRLPLVMTAFEFFTTVHDFYNIRITKADLREHQNSPELERALRDLREGRRVTWGDMLGTRDVYHQGKGDISTARRRGHLSCPGQFRFAGVALMDAEMHLRLW